MIDLVTQCTLKRHKHSQPVNRLMSTYHKMLSYTALIYILWNFGSLPGAFIHPHTQEWNYFGTGQTFSVMISYLLSSMQVSRSDLSLHIAYIQGFRTVCNTEKCMGLWFKKETFLTIRGKLWKTGGFLLQKKTEESALNAQFSSYFCCKL